MAPPRSTTLFVALFIASSVFSSACGGPARAIRPVTHADDAQAAAAMRSAPVILVVRISQAILTGDARNVEKPRGVAGPHLPAIPLHLSRIKADVLLTVKGRAQPTVEFYSWVWASGKHGGPRLFQPTEGGIRVVFLHTEGGYLHTVGDYPAYDLVFYSNWVLSLLSAWNSGQASDKEPIERLVALRLHAEFEGLSENQLHEDFGERGPRVNHHWAIGLPDLVKLVGPLPVVTQLDEICRESRNPSARFAACYITAQYFPGRCEAYRLARSATGNAFEGDLLAKLQQSCGARNRRLIDLLRSGAPIPQEFYGSSQTPPQRRETMRVYSSAMDPEVHRAACELAATMLDTRDIPECIVTSTR